MTSSTILLAEDEQTLRQSLTEVLEDEGFHVIACCDGEQAFRALKANSVDAIITDLRMPGITGMDLIEEAIKLASEAVIMVITAYGEVETAVETMKKGVRDYICKPLILDEVVFRLKSLLAHDDLAKENKLLRKQIRERFDGQGIVGKCAHIKAIREMVSLIAKTMSNVLICGESGTGKEVIARAIHYSGITKDKPFVAVNCGGLADTLVESELFGYRKGAFTGAERDRTGYFESANGGTLFLDEIGNLPLQSQAVLLRAIEHRSITRVGETRPRPVNIRVIAATNRNLSQTVEEGDFREDLFYRLNVVNITLLPLRERREDIPLLIDHFLDKYNKELNMSCPGFTSQAIEALVAYPWRGNIRELENAVERALIFANGHKVTAEELHLRTGPLAPQGPIATTLRDAVHEFERNHIARVIANSDGNKVEAARILGIGLSSLYRKLDELGIGRESKDTVVS